MIFHVVTRSGIFNKFSTPCFVLRQDNWNDFGYQTLYEMYLLTNEEEPFLIGGVKILKMGQTPEDSHQLVPGYFEYIDNDFCSIGQSLDYYERVAKLTQERRDLILLGLRDVVQHREIWAQFRDEPGWRTSLFRNFSENDDFIVLARTLLTRDYSTLPHLNLQFSFGMPGWNSALDFIFDAPDVDDAISWVSRRERRELPSRVAVLIGCNGAGKSTILARLARIAHASRSERERPQLARLGQIKPEGLGFPRIIAISYSAFDSFQIPGISFEEQLQIAKEMTTGEGRYVFCGLRDIARELDDEEPLAMADYDQTLEKDRHEKSLLKCLDQLADEFARTLDLIWQLGRAELLMAAAQPLLEDPSFDERGAAGFSAVFGHNARERFLGWSTGHKIALHVLVNLVAYTEPRAIILFDEPESHLHPPLLAGLMHSLRHILAKKDAFAIIATHSPVILQETMARNVQVVYRAGAQFDVGLPSIETFGENVGAITSEIFKLTSEVTDFHSTLRYLVRATQSIEEIEKLFEGGLSMQARGYVLGLLGRNAGGK